jgi:hypothetical protein
LAHVKKLVSNEVKGLTMSLQTTHRRGTAREKVRQMEEGSIMTAYIYIFGNLRQRLNERACFVNLEFRHGIKTLKSEIRNEESKENVSKASMVM